MHMFYRAMKRIYQFAANLLSYIPTKYMCIIEIGQHLTYILVIVKSKG